MGKFKRRNRRVKKKFKRIGTTVFYRVKRNRWAVYTICRDIQTAKGFSK